MILNPALIASTVQKEWPNKLVWENQKVFAETAHESMKSKIFVRACVCVITERTSMNRLISLRAQHVSECAGVVAAAFKARVYLLFSNLWLYLGEKKGALASIIYIHYL